MATLEVWGFVFLVLMLQYANLFHRYNYDALKPTTVNFFMIFQLNKN